MSQADAEVIALWHYSEPFSFYDWSADPNDLAELLDPALRGDACLRPPAPVESPPHRPL